MIRLGNNKINKMDYADIPINKAYYGDRLVHITYGTGTITPKERFDVDLQDQWQPSTSYGDITGTDYYEFYESFSNHKVGSGKASMIITISGYDTFTFKVRNDSESSYDYVVVNNLDDLSTPKWQPSQGDGLASNGKVYYTNKGKSSATVWYDVTFENLDGEEHKIMVTYGKDSSVDTEPDQGYVAIPLICENRQERLVEYGEICVGRDLYSRFKKQYRCSGRDWYDSGEYEVGELIESNSDLCQGKIVAKLPDGTTRNIECTDDHTLTRNEVSNFLDTLNSYDNYEIVVGKCVEKLGDYAFGNLGTVKNKITSLEFSEGLKYIAHEAFMELYSLTTLTIPSTVETIEFWTFTRLNGLTECILLPTTPPELPRGDGGGNVFHDYVPPVIWVPDESLEAYKTTGDWSLNASVYRPLSERPVES